MGDLPSILSRFRNEFCKFNNTGAGLLDYFDHISLKLREVARCDAIL